MVEYGGVSSESLADLADLADVKGKKYLKIWGWMWSFCSFEL